MVEGVVGVGYPHMVNHTSLAIGKGNLGEILHIREEILVTIVHSEIVARMRRNRHHKLEVEPTEH